MTFSLRRKKMSATLKSADLSSIEVVYVFPPSGLQNRPISQRLGDRGGQCSIGVNDQWRYLIGRGVKL